MPAPPPIGFHVMCRLTDNRVIAPTAEQRRIVASAVLSTFRPHRLLAFNVPDTHLHLEHLEDHALGAELTRRVLISVTRRLRLRVGFARPFPKPMRSQGHVFNAFDYIMTQQPNHDLDWDPYHEASNLPDLLGLRVVGQYTANHVRQHLQRVKRPLLPGYLGVEALEPADGPVERIVPATLAASGLLRLDGGSAPVRAAWRAALEVLGKRVSQQQAARALGVDRKTLWRGRRAPVDERLVRAIRLQLGLRLRVPGAPAGPFVAGGARP